MKNMKLKVLLVLCALLLLSAFIAERKEPITIFMIGDSTMANKSLKNGNIERGCVSYFFIVNKKRNHKK